jgi:hypothetical protein
MTAFGYDFRDGSTPEVTDANAIKRLSGNRYFEVLPDASETEEVEEVPPSPFVADVIAEAQEGINEDAPALPALVDLAKKDGDAITIDITVKKKPGRKPKTAQEP